MTRIVLRTILPIVLAAALAGCTGASYYASSLKGHVEIMSARKSVAKLIADPATPAPLRSRMEKADSIRSFAVGELALPDNRSYRSYVDIGRDWVSIAVFAAPEFALAPLAKCFPVFGCVAYQAYFSREAARNRAAELERQGLDVHVSGVTAYSTLGWTSDPLLSTMFRRDDVHLASLVFHELAHQRVYVNDDSAFNEAFAVAVEISGVKKWLRSNGDADALRRYEADLARNAAFLDLVARTRNELHEIYRGSASAEQKRVQKSAAIERLRQRYRAMRTARWNGDRGYDGWFEAPINNAKIAATSVYNDQVPAFLRLLELCSGDYPRFYAAVARFGALPKPARPGALEAVRACD